ncbi:hypothetical protein DSO57_1034625 [Entomophthora muscae]|uniref:Uncharacterized protein n=1 Tax=Entomophthora muscae TaxID=34485 RepID=A0ACC2TBN1_9FUNG|nr:hypothetical protein DSO57_1034625 [Entomophthora muscae]
MKYLPFDIAIRLIHVVRYVKGQLIERPLCIASLETRLHTINGAVKNANSTLVSIMRKLTYSDAANWDL